MSQLARIIRNLIDAEAYVAEHREWLNSLFLPLDAGPEELQNALRRNRPPMAAPEAAYVKEMQPFVRRTNERYVT